jgi:hypothetical protein
MRQWCPTQLFTTLQIWSWSSRMALIVIHPVYIQLGAGPETSRQHRSDLVSIPSFSYAQTEEKTLPIMAVPRRQKDLENSVAIAGESVAKKILNAYHTFRSSVHPASTCSLSRFGLSDEHASWGCHSWRAVEQRRRSGQALSPLAASSTGAKGVAVPKEIVHRHSRSSSMTSSCHSPCRSCQTHTWEVINLECVSNTLFILCGSFNYTQISQKIWFFLAFWMVSTNAGPPVAYWVFFRRVPYFARLL